MAEAREDNVREKVVISYFKCDSPQGDELYRETKCELERSGIQGLDVEVVLRENDTLTGIDAYMCDDIVIFDASLEGEEVGRQYDALIEFMEYSEYTLIVSRTILPFNVFGTWKGGYPRYIKAGIAYYPESLTNLEILSWLKDTVGRMELPNSRKISRNEFYKFSIMGRNRALIARGKTDYAAEGARYKQQLEAFVSYCSRYSHYFSNQNLMEDSYTVEDLIQFISEKQGIPTDEIGYFPPGKLSRELMTLQRRWEVVSDTFKLILACAQLWILDAPGYWESWWTLSERVTLSYILLCLPEYCPHIYIAKFNSKRGSFQVKAYLSLEEKRRLLPKLSKQTLRTINLYFANSRANSIGCYLRNSKSRKWMRKFYNDFHLKPEKLRNEDTLSIMETKELLRPCWGSRPDSDNFWDDFILECPTCKQESRHTRYSEKGFLYPQSNPFCHVVRKEDLQQTGQDMFLYTCPSCGRNFYFRPESYYRWYPMRVDSLLGLPNAKLVERKEIYVFETDKEQ